MALIWRREDVFGEREVLTCTQCQHQVDQSEIMITRDAQQHRGDAPDILFTTTEMLNLQMNSTWSNHLFGVGEGYGPTLVLLDEVHTYSGTTGAQTAFLLRRWMAAHRLFAAFCWPVCNAYRRAALLCQVGGCR